MHNALTWYTLVATRQRSASLLSTLAAKQASSSRSTSTMVARSSSRLGTVSHLLRASCGSSRTSDAPRAHGLLGCHRHLPQPAVGSSCAWLCWLGSLLAGAVWSRQRSCCGGWTPLSLVGWLSLSRFTPRRPGSVCIRFWWPRARIEYGG